MSADAVDLAVVGGGISGLAAAWEAEARGAGVVVLDGAERVGGKLVTSDVGGIAVDEAADAFLARVPEAVALCAELGLDTELVAPATGSAYLFIDGALRRLPADQLLGIPTDLDAVAATGILSPSGVARARSDLTAPDDRPTFDESVGAFVRRRLGDEVLDRLVAPLIGGIWAGDCDRLSLAVTAPQLAALHERGPSVIASAAAARAEAQQAAADAGDRPVFLAPRGGMARLPAALAERLGDRVRTGTPVTTVVADGTRWKVEPAGIVADAVVVATPAFAAGGIVADVAPAAAGLLGGIAHASVALIALVVPRRSVGRELDGSGFLVPRSAGLTITACSWVTSKWDRPDVGPDDVVLRASAGHAADDRPLALTDEALAAAVLDDLATTMDLRGAPAAVRVSRWPRSFPQPRPGHPKVVDRIEADVAAASPRLAVTGAWARGVGIPACIRGGRAAAARVLSL